MPVISIENADYYNWGKNCEGWHLAKSENLSVIQERVPPGSSEVKHFHQNSEQFFYILSGTATMEIAGIVYQLQENQGMYVEAGKVHQLSNQHAQDLLFLVISTPPSYGDRVMV